MSLSILMRVIRQQMFDFVTIAICTACRNYYFKIDKLINDMDIAV